MRNTPATGRIEIQLVLDTWTWIEYWRGNKRVREFCEGPHSRITSVITVAELERHYGTDLERMDRMIAMIRARSLLVPVDPAIARTAGSVRRSMKEGGIADAIIHATALAKQAKVVTGDPQFRTLDDVIFIGTDHD